MHSHKVYVIFYGYCPNKTPKIKTQTIIPQAYTLLLVALHLNLFNSLPRRTSCPQLAISPSTRPTSLPHAKPALNEMAEKTRTTPADIIHEVSVGPIKSSLIGVLTGLIFLECLSLLDSLDFRLDCFGDGALRGGIVFSSDSGTNRSVVGTVLGLVGVDLSGAFGRTAAAHDSNVVSEARSAAS